MRTIQQIDETIDANHRALMARVHCDPGMSATAWQNAWDRCPDLHKRERELYLERYDAQCERDRLIEREHQRQQRAERAAHRKAQRNIRQCPTCGSYSLAA